MKRDAITLIELLIVVAILGVITAIAVPNYRDAMIKSRVARAKMDLRALGGALQTYRLDHNIFPRRDTDLLFFADYLLPDLTSPIAYLSSPSLRDPFGPVAEYQEPKREPEDSFVGAADYPVMKNSYTYTPYVSFARLHGLESRRREAFAVGSVGPDQMDSFIVDVPFPDSYRYPGDTVRDSIYDPSNGILSLGDIGCFGGDIRIQGLLGG